MQRVTVITSRSTIARKKRGLDAHYVRACVLGVSATSEACHNLQGESPCRARRSLPPVSSLARYAESEISEYFSA